MVFSDKSRKENETPFYNDRISSEQETLPQLSERALRFAKAENKNPSDLIEEVNLSSTFTWSTYVIVFGALGILALRDRAKAKQALKIAVKSFFGMLPDPACLHRIDRSIAWTRTLLKPLPIMSDRRRGLVSNADRTLPWSRAIYRQPG